jgi:uncharacterized membrane protein
MQARQLADRLSDWTGRGLVTEEQRRRILEYEGARTAGQGRSWVLYGLLMLGGSVVGIGVISLIAANWEEIPAGAKLAGAFAVLAALAWFAYRARAAEDRPIRFDVLAMLLSLGVLGTIGLVAQVYHTGGELFLALAFWLLAIAPLAWSCGRGFVPQLWVAGSLAALVAWALAERWWEGLGFDRGHENAWSLFLGAPLLCLLASNLAARRPSLRAFSRGYAGWAQLGALVAIAFLDVCWSLDGPRIDAFWIGAVVVVAVLAAATLWLRDDLPGKGRLAVVALVTVGVLGFAPFAAYLGGHHHGEKWPELIGAAFSVVALLLLAALFAARDRRRGFNAMTVLVGVRLLIVYLQVIGDLATTGLGLVVSGLVIIGVALLWFKTRARVEALFGGLLR